MQQLPQIDDLLSQYQSNQAVYVNAVGCLPCIQPALDRFETDSSILMILHPRIDFLEKRYQPRVHVDWKGALQAIDPDTTYFHLITRHTNGLHIQAFQEINDLMEELNKHTIF